MSERKQPATKRLRLTGTSSTTKSLGFSSAATLLDATNHVGNSTDKNDATKSKQRARMSGFCSAATVLMSPEVIQSDEKKCISTESTVQSHESTSGSASTKSVNRDVEEAPVMEAQEPTSFEMTLTVVGWMIYRHLHEDSFSISEGTTVVLEREVENEYDSNAIAVLTTDNNKVGHITKEEAAILASHLDSGAIQKSNASIRKCEGKSFQLFVDGITNGSQSAMAAVKSIQERYQDRSMVSAANYSHSIVKMDVERSQSAPYMLKDLKALPWNPVPDWQEHERQSSLPWTTPFDPAKFHSTPLTVEEIQAAQSSSWPPSDDILLRLGMAPSANREWWNTVGGLLPPCEWNVTGALDVLPHIRTSSRSQKRITATTLDGAIHGVTGVWSPDTLVAIGQLIHEKDFWCCRGPDALIRAFGGPYVLGQDQDNLKLIRGAHHTELTQKMSIAHSLVYATIHLVPPTAPGFNTLIFGCNLRGAGFNYHRDAIPSLKAKNAPLVPRQPVVTTVFYEKPAVDSGKEIVLWKPITNFSPIGDGTRETDAYLGARALPTLHGTVHVQRAGLQMSAKHGIFHAPDTTERSGYRVAITARITKCNPEETLTEHLDTYKVKLGPEGDMQLRPNHN